VAIKQIVMPQAGQDLETGMVREWLKQVGDPVRKGETVVVVETEKISLDVASPIDGVLREILVPDGTETAIFSVIGTVADADEPVP
jgi:pyruvate dehydrogenase E2 component (dihydrolipoyllysine-residue acetyltransferase)